MSVGDLGAFAGLCAHVARRAGRRAASLGRSVGQSSARDDVRAGTAPTPRPRPRCAAPARLAGRGGRGDAVDQRRSSPSGPAPASRRAGRGRRAPDRRPRPARPGLGDAGPAGADVLGAAAPRRARRPSWPWLPLLTGLRRRRPRSADRLLDVALKWPNDVLVDGGWQGARSPGSWSSGSTPPAGRRPSSASGINVDADRATSCPVPTATSLALEPASRSDRTDLLGQVLGSAARPAGPARRRRRRCAAAYAAVCVTLGRDGRRRPARRAPCAGAGPRHRRRAGAGGRATARTGTLDACACRRRACTCRSAPSDMIGAWPPESCSTRASTSSSPPAPTPRR